MVIFNTLNGPEYLGLNFFTIPSVRTKTTCPGSNFLSVTLSFLFWTCFCLTWAFWILFFAVTTVFSTNAFISAERWFNAVTSSIDGEFDQLPKVFIFRPKRSSNGENPVTLWILDLYAINTNGIHLSHSLLLFSVCFRSAFIRIEFHLSVIPLVLGEYELVTLCSIPVALSNFATNRLLNSKPWSLKISRLGPHIEK